MHEEKWQTIAWTLAAACVLGAGCGPNDGPSLAKDSASAEQLQPERYWRAADDIKHDVLNKGRTDRGGDLFLWRPIS